MKILSHSLFAPVAKTLALGSLAVVLSAGALRAEDDSKPKGKETALNSDEQSYLQGVAKDNLTEIALAYLAIEKSATNDVKSYAKSIIDTHTKTMKELLEIASKHDAFLQLKPDEALCMKLEQLGGKEFDKGYVEAELNVNQTATDKLNGLMSKLTADDVKDFAKTDLKDDESHIKKAQDLSKKLDKGE